MSSGRKSIIETWPLQKTMNFLTEHQIEQYADLVSRIEEYKRKNEETANALKSVENVWTDMAVLMKVRCHLPKDKTSL